jgi:hypothetical protein
MVLALAAAVAAQSSGSTNGNPPANTPAATTGGGAGQSTPAAQPAPGTTPVGGDQPAPPKSDPGLPTASNDKPLPPCPVMTEDKDAKKDKKKDKDKDAAADAPGTTPVGGDCDSSAVAVSPDKIIDPGSQMIKIKPGSIEDVSAVGNRDIGARGMGNWYSTDSEIKMGKQYADEIEKSTKFITDPVIDEYVNRIGQNIVKNSDCKVPFTIKVIDSDEINAMALPGGFFYVNSGLILNADEEAELAGVMAHETAHVCAHHAAREMTRLNYVQIGMVPLIMLTGYTWTGYGIYEAAQLAIPITSSSSRANSRRRPTTSASNICTAPGTIHRHSSASLRRCRRSRSASRDWWPRHSAIIRRRRIASCTRRKRLRAFCRQRMSTR